MGFGGFSWKRALGISAAKAKVSRSIGIPLTKGGRQRKLGKAMGGCCVAIAMGIGVLTATWCSSRLVQSVSAEDAPKEKTVTLRAPYPRVYKDAPTDKLSVQYAVKEIAKQAGRQYDWNASQKYSGPVARRWIKPDIRDVPFPAAMARILLPLGLTWSESDGTVMISIVVFVTETGTQYHTRDCHHAKKSGLPTSLRDATKSGRSSCDVCKPYVPEPDSTAP
jgi:hypothetical protein